MSKIYVSNHKANERAAGPYLDRLRADGHTLILAEGGAADAGNLRKADILLVLLGEAQDLLEVKQDVNVALDRKQPVAAVYFGEPALDKGLEVQLGLAEKVFAPADGSFDETPMRFLREAIERILKVRGNRRKKKAIRTAAIVFAVLFCLVCTLFFLLTRPRTPPEDPGDTLPAIPEHIEMEEALLTGLVANGIDTNGDGYIQEAELLKAEVLDLANCGIADVTPLAKATGLAELDLANNAIKTCAPLLALKSLTKLDLTGNPLEDASNLAFFTWVTDLRYDGGTK